jgi:hypothetical protein
MITLLWLKGAQPGRHRMKLGFGAAMAASLSFLLFSSPAASQTTSCAELRGQLSLANNDILYAYRNYYAFNYDFKVTARTDAFNHAVMMCYKYDSNMSVECVQDAETSYEADMQALNDDKDLLDAEITAAESAWWDIRQQMYDANCSVN